MNWFQNLSIRQKLTVGFGTIIILVFVLASTSFLMLRSIRETIEYLVEHDVKIAEISLQADIIMLEAHSAERDYLLTYKTLGLEEARNRYISEAQTKTDSMLDYFEELKVLIDEDEFSAPLDEMIANAILYKTGFLDTVELIEQRGHDDTGVVGEFRAKIHEIEDLVTEENLDQLTIDKLTIRRIEKNYLLRGDLKYLDEMDVAIDLFKTNIQSSDIEAIHKTSLINLTDEYHVLFNQLVAIDVEIADGIESYRESIHLVEEPSTELYIAAVANQDIAYAELQQTINNLIIVTVVLSLITLGSAIMISQTTANPLSRAIRATAAAANLISEGRLNVSLADDRKDELGDMARSFNQMINYQQNMAQIANLLARGNLNVNIEPQSEEDVLGNAFVEMLTYQQAIAIAAQQVAQGNLLVEANPLSKEDILGTAFSAMLVNLRRLTKENEAQIWSANGRTELNDMMRGQPEIATLLQNIIGHICRYLEAQVGAIYLKQEDNVFSLTGSYAYVQRKSLSNRYSTGEGIIGQAALERSPILISNVPDDYVKVNSGLGESAPRHIMAMPLMFEDQALGVLELGTLHQFTSKEIDFVTVVAENIAVAVNGAHSREQVNNLLARTQQQTEELQVQQEELRVTNEELSEQTERLKSSEARLREQQAELEEANAELEESASSLQLKQESIDQQNKQLRLASESLKHKAEELTLASKYKSEFLANMSHELRTPLNSLLILSRMLATNDEGTLTDGQVEAAQIIYSGGQDLLSLINEILDLARVESGKIEFHIEHILLRDMLDGLRGQFIPLAEEKGLEFEVMAVDALPQSLQTDSKRLQQILKNLLGNALKFTSEGSVTLQVTPVDASVVPSSVEIVGGGEALAFAVKDTGIGVDIERQRVIFEAFQQADGSTNRQYGGTGLGLSISRELAVRLGGGIGLESVVGEGSVFTLYLPVDSPDMEATTVAAPIINASIALQSKLPIEKEKVKIKGREKITAVAIVDDRHKLQQQDKTLLIVEDDTAFAKVLFDFTHKKGFKCLIAHSAEEGLELAQVHAPSGIILDLNLPTMSGWEFMDNLKRNPDTRHIPVHIMSVYDTNVMDAYKRGAIGYLTKPVSKEDLEESFSKLQTFIERKNGKILLVEDDTTLRYSVKTLLKGEDVTILEATTGNEALAVLKEQVLDCMILDLSLPDISGMEVLQELHDNRSAYHDCPIIIYTGQELTREDSAKIMQYADSIIVKGIKSPERLLDETALFLHQVVADMPSEKQETIRQLYNQESGLAGKKILIVDDDMRNSFALSKLLAERGILVEIAPNGQKALEVVSDQPDINLILMDVMMPVMDGLETTRRIRQLKSKARTLPIITLTAKAMKGDREACIEAGANDYLSKPIDVDRLFSMLRVWLY